MDNKYSTVKIVKVEKENERVKNFVLNAAVSAKPGQYIMLWIPRLNEKPFGVAVPNPLTLSIAKVGYFTEIVHNLHKGDEVSFRGPYGSHYKYDQGKALLIGGGYGVVPLYFLAYSTEKSKRKNFTVITGARTKNELAFVTKFKDLGVNLEVATDDGSVGFKGFSTKLAAQLMQEKKFDHIYTCGPEPMMYKIAQLSAQQDVPCQVSMERYFRCGGFGLCGACTYKGYVLCTEGPVLPGKVILEE